MISDEKRREVAARLRVYSHDFDFDDSNPFWYVAKAAFGDVDVHTYYSVFARLADLIDRPTCRDVADFDRESFKCSRCGFRVLSIDGAPDAAKLVGTKGGVIDFGFCPNCGATVTEGGGCYVREL